MVNTFEMNKRGIIRILEASAAILIIFIVVLTFSMMRKSSTERDLSTMINPLLEEIAKNNSMREVIISTNVTNETSKNDTIKMILKFLNSTVEPNIDRDANICEIGVICTMNGGYPKDIIGNVYAGSRIISSVLESDASKRVSIFLWFKK